MKTIPTPAGWGRGRGSTPPGIIHIEPMPSYPVRRIQVLHFWILDKFVVFAVKIVESELFVVVVVVAVPL